MLTAISQTSHCRLGPNRSERLSTVPGEHLSECIKDRTEELLGSSNEGDKPAYLAVSSGSRRSNF